VCPLVAVVVNVVSNFAEQNAFRLQHPASLFQERRERVRESVVILFG